ncbi:Y-box-binding protein 1-like [Pseudophryne corroboree]|uniref:Y-box-binding protein 1-like n=1 Tax=Pseudophryne corroboree TaxID=495146 RepID=UPI003081DBFD
MESIGLLLEEEQPGGVSLNPVVQNHIKAIGMPSAGDVTPASAGKVLGKVVWFHERRGYGFINRDDNKRNIFEHYTGIQPNNPRNCFRSLRNGETVEFSLVKGEKGADAENVTSLGGAPVQGNKDEAYHNHYWSFSHCRGPPSNYQQDHLHSDDRETSEEVESVAEEESILHQQPYQRCCYPPCYSCPNIQVQSALRESVTSQQVEKQRGSIQKILQRIVGLQHLQEPPHKSEPGVKGTHSRITHFNQPDVLATNGKQDTEGKLHSAMTESKGPPEQN